MNPVSLVTKYNLDAASLENVPATRRYLGDLRGCFADGAAYELAIAKENPLVYSVASVESANGEGQLHYGLGMLMPGKVGREYYLTKGHLHAWRPAAEVYVGLRGAGFMLLEPEDTGESELVPLDAGRIVYVPGHCAHRTINAGTEPLVYLGIYPAAAGHDYGAIAERNFQKILVEQNGQPTLIDRSAY